MFFTSSTWYIIAIKLQNCNQQKLDLYFEALRTHLKAQKKNCNAFKLIEYKNWNLIGNNWTKN